MSLSALIPHALRKASLSCCNALVRARRLRPLITLKPGETQTVSFPIDIEALKFWNQQMKYDAEPGKFNVFIGTDSARVKKGEFELL